MKASSSLTPLILAATVAVALLGGCDRRATDQPGAGHTSGNMAPGAGSGTPAGGAGAPAPAGAPGAPGAGK